MFWDFFFTEDNFFSYTLTTEYYYILIILFIIQKCILYYWHMNYSLCFDVDPVGLLFINPSWLRTTTCDCYRWIKISHGHRFVTYKTLWWSPEPADHRPQRAIKQCGGLWWNTSPVPVINRPTTTPEKRTPGSLSDDWNRFRWWLMTYHICGNGIANQTCANRGTTLREVCAGDCAMICYRSSTHCTLWTTWNNIPVCSLCRTHRNRSRHLFYLSAS